jgi:hypothetical protein
VQHACVLVLVQQNYSEHHMDTHTLTPQLTPPPPTCLPCTGTRASPAHPPPPAAHPLRRELPA